MINDLLEKEEIKSFINDIKTSEKYFLKQFEDFHRYRYEISKEIVLFTFYEALFKYKIIIEDDVYLFDYLNDLDRLFKKIEKYSDISDGINKLICKVVANKLCIDDMNTYEAREKIITYIFDKYYVNGYLFHGFSTVYEEDLKNHDFIPGIYKNNYSKMLEINDIYKKYGEIAFDKDFDDKKVSFTDNFVEACYYSLYSPKFLYKFLLDDSNNKKCFLDDNYNVCINKYIKTIDDKFENSDIIKIKDILKEELDLLNSVDRRVSLLIIKRNCVENIDYELLDVLLSSDEILYELADRLLGSSNKAIDYLNTISKDSYEVFSLNYKSEVENKKMREEKEVKKEEVDIVSVTQDVSGSVTVIMLLGSLFISLGVIFTLIMLLGGN